jgi:hypothetical protein
MIANLVSRGISTQPPRTELIMRIDNNIGKESASQLVPKF